MRVHSSLVVIALWSSCHRFAGGEDTEAKTGQFVIPNDVVLPSRLGGVDDPFRLVVLVMTISPIGTNLARKRHVSTRAEVVARFRI